MADHAALLPDELRQALYGNVRVPQEGSETALYAHLAAQYPEFDTVALFDQLVTQERFWSRKHFPKEFDKALKTLKQASDNPMEGARAEFLRLLTKSGQLDEFIKSVLPPR